MVLSRDKMVLLTLNAHSLMEPDTTHCLTNLAKAMAEQQVRVLCLQEINQSRAAEMVPEAELQASGFVACPGERPIRAGNFALLLAQLLRAQGLQYHWTWAFVHYGYRDYEEAWAVFTLDEMDQWKTA